MKAVGEGKWWSFRVAVIVLAFTAGVLAWIVIDREAEIIALRGSLESEQRVIGRLAIDAKVVDLNVIDSTIELKDGPAFPPGDYPLNWPPGGPEFRPEIRLVPWVD